MLVRSPSEGLTTPPFVVPGRRSEPARKAAQECARMSWNRNFGSRSYRPTARARGRGLGAALVCMGLMVVPSMLVAPPVASARVGLDPVAVPAEDTTSAPAASDVSGGPDVVVTPPVPAATDLELALFTLTNADRAARGIAPLALDTDLLAVARARAAAQVPLPALSHYDASGGFAVVPLLAATGVPYRTWGEKPRPPAGDGRHRSPPGRGGADEQPWPPGEPARSGLRSSCRRRRRRHQRPDRVCRSVPHRERQLRRLMAPLVLENTKGIPQPMRAEGWNCPGFRNRGNSNFALDILG